MESVSDVISSTNEASSDLFSQWDEDIDFTKLFALKDELREQQRIRAEEFELQKKLIELQIESNEIKNRMMQDPNKAMLSVKIDPAVEPALEMVMKYILEHTRIWGTEYGFSQLLEVPV
jgi:hypothetical protein